MPEFGVTSEGFVLKPVDVILSESFARARTLFGDSIDLTTTSPLRKILETTAVEDGELWKRMEDLYYANFVSTAVGDALNLLGEDLGLPRPQLASTGTVQITLKDAAKDRTYVLPEGTILVTSSQPVRAFGTTAAVTLGATTTVGVAAFEPGPGGDVPAGAIVALDPTYRSAFLADFGTATLTVTNPKPLEGGLSRVSDEVYRAQLLGLARNMWTVDAVTQAALGVTGVLDVVLTDPQGGVDVSQSYFGLFKYDERVYGGERRVGEPHSVTLVVAHEPRMPWRTAGSVTGIFERVSAAVDRVRPIGVHANIIEANHIDIGVRATVLVQPGSDGPAILASVRQRLAGDVGVLRLGGDVLYSQVVRAFVSESGVLDVQGLHLRRSPASFGRITYGAVPFQNVVAEAAVGENLVMGPTELAIFPTGSETFDVTLVTR